MAAVAGQSFRRVVRTLIAAVLLIAFGGASAPANFAQAAEPPLLRIEPGGHTAQVRAIAFTPDGKYLLSVGKDKTIRVWDRATGRQSAALRYQTTADRDGECFALAVHPTLPMVAVGLGGSDADILLFDYQSGKQARRLRGHHFVVTSLVFSPDGATLLSAGADGTARLWDPVTGAEKHRTDVVANSRKQYLFAAAFAPAGDRYAVAAQDGTVRVYDASHTEVKRLDAGAEVHALAWSSAGLIAAGTANGVLHLWDPATGADEALPRLPDSISCLAFDSSGKRLLSGGGERGADFKARVWSVADRTISQELSGHTTTIFTTAFAPAPAASGAGEIAATGDAFGVIQLWDTDSGQITATLRGTGKSAFSVAWSGDGQRVAWSDRYGGPLSHAFDLNNAAPAAAPPAGGLGYIRSATQMSNGLHLTLDPDARVVQIRDSAGKIVKTLPAEEGDQIKSMAFCPDGNHVVVGSDLYLGLWSIDGGRPRRVRLFEGHQGSVLGVAVSPDGRYLASGGADQTVRIWPIIAGSEGDGPLLSLCADDEAWIAWTRLGYFAASPGGDERIGWQVNRGPDRAADYYPAGSFWKLYYRPDVLVRLFAGGSLAAAVQQADSARPAAPKTDPAKTADNLAGIAPPDVAIVEPLDGAVVTASALTLRARITDPNGRAITRVLARVNAAGGRGLDFGNIAASTAATDWSQTVHLQPGDNIVTLVAENDARAQSAPRYVHVTYRPDQPAARPSLYVLSVGISKYPPGPVPALTYAAKDAADFSAVFAAQEGRLFGKVVYKSIVTDADATHNRIEQELDGLAKEPIAVQDYVILFLSGHGTPIDPAHGNRDYCFVTADAQLGNMAATTETGQDLLDRLSGLNCNVLVFLDTCRAGSAILRADDPNLALRYLAGKIDYGRVMIYGCGPTESSQESDNWHNGAFTNALVRGMNGAATPTRHDTAGNGILTLLDLESYLLHEVPSMTGGQQNPRVDIPSYVPLRKADFPIALIPAASSPH